MADSRARVTSSGPGVEVRSPRRRRRPERRAYWPFTHDELQADLLAAGSKPAASTFDPDVARYLVTARANSSNASR